MKDLAFRLKIIGSDTEIETFGELKKLIKETQKELDNTKIGTQRFEELKQTVSDAKSEQVKLRQELRANQKAFEGLKAVPGSYRAIQGQVTASTEKLRNMAVGVNATEKEFKELRAEIDMNKRKLRDFDRSVSGANQLVGEYDLGIKNAVKSMFSMKGVLATLGPAIIGAFSIQAVSSYVSESIKLAAAAEGVERAFAKLDQSKVLLQEMKAATRGTVSELELMKAAVNASNFKIPLEQMGGLLEFAARRARDTGQNVDYLTESIVLGIARKSPLILDNLGLSINEINEELKQTPDFAQAVGKVIEREMEKAGEAADTAADKMERQKATWADLQVEAGQFFIKLGGWAAQGLEYIDVFARGARGFIYGAFSGATAFVNEFLEQVKKSFTGVATGFERLLNRDFDGAMAAFGSSMKISLSDLATKANEGVIEGFKKGFAKDGGLFETVEQAIRKPAEETVKAVAQTLKGLEEELSKLKDLQKLTSSREQYLSIEKEILAVEREIEAITGADALKSQADAVKDLTKERKELLKSQEDFAKLRQDQAKEELKAAMTWEDQKKEEYKAEQNINRVKEAKRKNLQRENDLQGSMNDQIKEQEDLDKQRQENMQSLAGTFGVLAVLAKDNTTAYKALASAEAVMNTYAAANKALGSAPPPFNFIAMAATIAAGLVNVAKINSTQFAHGGVVDGPSHAQGGVKYFAPGGVVELEGGEVVVNKKSSQKFKNVLSNINSHNGWGVKFAAGGTVPALGNITPPDLSSLSVDRTGQLREIRDAVKSLKVYVVQKEMSAAQRKEQRIKSEVSFKPRS